LALGLAFFNHFPVAGLGFPEGEGRISTDGPQISAKITKARVTATEFMATEFCEISSGVLEGF
jgi:hypothetical protein